MSGDVGDVTGASVDDEVKESTPPPGTMATLIYTHARIHGPLDVTIAAERDYRRCAGRAQVTDKQCLQLPAAGSDPLQHAVILKARSHLP